MKKDDFELKYIVVVITALIFAYSFREWFFSIGILTKGDWGFFLNETATTIRVNYFSLWLSDNSFGRVLIDVAQAPTYFMYGIFAKYFSFTYAINERLIHFCPTIIVSILSSYLLLKKYFKENLLAVLIGILVYLLNTYFLDLLTGDVTLATAFAFGPALIFLLENYIESPTLARGIIIAIISSITIAYEPRSFYVIVLVLVMQFVYKIFCASSIHIKENLKRIIAPSLFIILINVYWLIGLLKIGSFGSNSVVNRGLFGSQYWNILYSFTIHHPWWSGSAVQVFQNQIIPVWFWLIPLIAFTGLILNRRNITIVLFGIISLLGIFLSKQTGQPFSYVYPWLYAHFPGFNVFREASKFYVLVSTGYMVLVGSFVDWLFRNWHENKVRSICAYILYASIYLVLIFNLKPFITNEIGTLFVTRQIPNDYSVFSSYLLKQIDYSRTYWVPRDSRWGMYTDTHSRLSGVDVIQSNWRSLSTLDNSAKQQDQIIDIFKHVFSQSLFDVSSIKYVAVSIQDNTNDDDFFIDYGGKKDPNIRQWYIDQLDMVKWLKKIDIGTNNLTVYENDSYMQPIFSFPKLYNINSFNNLDNKINFINKLSTDKYYISDANVAYTAPLVSVFDLFENVMLNNGVISDRYTSRDYLSKLYINMSKGDINNNLYNNNKNIENGDVLLKNNLNVFEYRDSKFSLNNIIENASFENGLWTSNVGDCNNYDNHPILAMVLNKDDKTDGNQSLQLEATRHIACTSVNIHVIADKTYQLSFDYQSPNSDHASYYLGYNDIGKTFLNENIPIKNTLWNTFSKKIKIPKSANIITLNVYAESTDGSTNIINRYDNFKLIEVPDLTNAYYLVSDPGVELKDPSSVTFELINPTKKLVNIKGATTPFFLGMSESYHQKWQLQFNNSKVNGSFNSWIPFVSPDRISDEYHYKLDDFLNAWYVDTGKYCDNNENLCKKNTDGSYDMEMVIEFFPQRWFYLGLLISGTTLSGCILYLVYIGVKKIKIKLNNKNENIK